MSRVLVVVDMQKDFVAGALATEEAKAIVSNVVKKVQEFDGAVVFTRDTHGEDYLETQEGRHLPIVHCVQDSEGWELIDELNAWAEEHGSLVFDKDTFGSRELIEYLKALDEEQPLTHVEIIGLCTDICVISNALSIKTHLPEVPIYVDAACCAGVSEESHDTALAAMKACQVQVC